MPYRIFWRHRNDGKICKLLVFYCLEGNEEVVLVVHPKSEFWAGMWLTPVAQSGLFGTWLPLGTTLPPPPAPTAGGKSNIRLLENHWVESLWFLTAWQNKNLWWDWATQYFIIVQHQHIEVKTRVWLFGGEIVKIVFLILQVSLGQEPCFERKETNRQRKPVMTLMRIL